MNLGIDIPKDFYKTQKVLIQFAARSSAKVVAVGLFRERESEMSVAEFPVRNETARSPIFSIAVYDL